jgi:hypothetical protein
MCRQHKLRFLVPEEILAFWLAKCPIKTWVFGSFGAYGWLTLPWHFNGALGTKLIALFWPIALERMATWRRAKEIPSACHILARVSTLIGTLHYDVRIARSGVTVTQLLCFRYHTKMY